MDIQIWADSGEPHPGRTYADALLDRLAGRGHRIEVTHHRDAHLPVGADLLILTGGETAVHDQTWMPAALERVRAVLESDTPVLGICLGAQMIAAAIAGSQIVRERGTIDVGMKRGIGFPARSAMLAQFHYHEIDPSFADHPGVVVRAATCECLVTEFTYRHATGVQYHPEFSANYLAELVIHNAATIEAHGGDVDQARFECLVTPVDDEAPHLDRLVAELTGERA